MDKRKSIQVDESTWAHLKNLALEDRTTLAAVVTSLVRERIQLATVPQEPRGGLRIKWEPPPSPVKDLTYDPES